MFIGTGIGIPSGQTSQWGRYTANGYTPEVVLDFTGEAYRAVGVSGLSGVATFARTSTAMYFNSAGLMVSASSGVARVGHHEWSGSAWVNKGLRLESFASTNLALWCRDFTNAAWTKTSITAAKTATGVDGVGNSASTLTASGANGTVLQTITSTSASRLTSVYIKRRTGSGVVELTQDNGVTWTPVTVGTTQYALCWIAAVTSANPTFGIRIVTSGDAVDVDMFQHELTVLPTAVPSSPIVTTTASATRAAETLTIAAANLAWNAAGVSLAVKGEVNYADTGYTFEMNPLRWQLDGSNTINLYMSTVGTRTGQPNFQHSVGGVTVSVGGSNSSYSPGLNVPFSWASRHSTTAINGSHNGTLLTAGVTASLVNLSAANLAIGFAFNGTIQTVRQWGSDIGDTGISTAST